MRVAMLRNELYKKSAMPPPYSPAQQQQWQQSHGQILPLKTSCLNRIPLVNCRDDSPCLQWAAQNCSESDKLYAVPFCDKKEQVCAFTGYGKDPTIYAGT